MILSIRKLIVLVMILGVMLIGNILVVANWLTDTGAVEVAQGLRSEYLTGTAITILIALLILLANPRGKRCISRSYFCFIRRK